MIQCCYGRMYLNLKRRESQCMSCDTRYVLEAEVLRYADGH